MICKIDLSNPNFIERELFKHTAMLSALKQSQVLGLGRVQLVIKMK